MVASKVVLPLVPPVTRLPGATRRSPMRPLIGARNSVNSRSSSAWRSSASAPLTDGLRVAIGLRALLEGLLGDGLFLHQLLAAREIGLGEGQIGFRLRQRGARLRDRVLERPLVDREQQVALLDQLAVLEVHAVEIAGHARAHFDQADRGEAADIFVEIENGALGRLGDRHRRRRRTGLLLLARRRNWRARVASAVASIVATPARR